LDRRRKGVRNRVRNLFHKRFLTPYSGLIPVLILVPFFRSPTTAEWSSARATTSSYATRVSNLRDGTGSGDRANDAFFLTPSTVHDDAVADVLAGNAGLDWFLARLLGTTRDKTTDRSRSEILDAI